VTSAAPSRATQAFALVKTLVFFAIVPGAMGGYLPYSLLDSPAVPAWTAWSPLQWGGAAVFALGVTGLLWCGWNFAVIGLGTPAVWDAPRRLVVRGPYRCVRNPMYVAVGTAILGQSLFFGSVRLLPYLAIFGSILHLFVVFYEEPALREQFGADYEAYCRRVWRWIPRPPRSTG